MSYLQLTKKDAEAVVKELNHLLADYHLYYQKLRNFHWNVKGSNFFDLHEKFEEMYEDARMKIDEIAERILTLRSSPMSNLSEYLKLSEIKEAKTNLADEAMVKDLLKDHGTIINTMNGIVDLAGEKGDEGTIDLIGAYIRELEKVSWMLDSWAQKK